MSGVQSVSEMGVLSGVPSVEELGLSSIVEFLSPIGATMFEFAVEATVIALALHLYLRVTRKASSLLNPVEKGLKTIPQKVACVPAAAPECSKELNNLVAAVLAKGGMNGHDALDKYEALARGDHMNLRHHIGDDQIARSFYLALVEGAVNLAAASGVPSSDAFSSAKPISSRLLADMRLYGFQRNHEFYSSILKAHVVGRLHADALWLYDVMVADGVTPDRTMYIHLLSVAVACGLSQKATSYFKEVLKTGPPPMRTYMTMLRVHTKESDWKSAVELLEGLRRADSSPDALVLNTVLGICISEGKVDMAEKLLFQWLDIFDVVSCNVVLKGFAQRVDLPRSESLLRHMLDSGPAPNIISFNTIMDCAVRTLAQSQGGEWRSARSDDADKDRLALGEALARRPWQFLDQLLQLGLEPDRYTCSTLVKGLHLTGASAQDIDRTVHLLRSVGPAGLQSAAAPGAGAVSGDAPSSRLLEVLFNTLLDACVSIRDLVRMGEVFRMMTTFKVEVSAVTFSTLIKAFGQAGQLSHCHEVWQNMRDANVKPTIVTFGCYIDVCIRNHDMASAEHAFESMAAVGVKPNSVIYTSLVRGYANMKKPIKALELYRQMQAQGIQATTVTFNSVLDMMVRQLDDPSHLQEILEDMRAASVPPDLATYSILIKASCNAGRVDSAIALFRQLRQRGLAFDEVAFNTLLLACSKADQVDMADEVLGEMRSSGIAPTQVTVSILVKMYGKAKMLDKAIELGTMVEEKYGMQPNLHVFTCLIQACVRNRQIRKSWDVFGNMLRTGVPPDAITYGTLIHGCIYTNKFDQAMALVRHAYSLAKGSSLVLSLGLNTNLGANVLKEGPMVRLQQDVLKMLMAALKRKGQVLLVDELEVITKKHGHAHVPSGRD